MKILLLGFLEDRKEIKKLNEKHFNTMLSLYNETKRLYEETVRIQQEIIQKINNNVSKVQSVPHKNEIIITGVPNDISDEPRIIAEKIFEKIGIENPKSVIVITRKIVKKSHTPKHNRFTTTTTNKSACDDTKSIIVSLIDVSSKNKIIRRKCSHPNLKSPSVFPSTKNCSVINLNNLHSAEFYKLILDTRSFLSSKGLSMPKIYNNNKILVKMDNNHPPISIKVRADLENLMLLL